MGGFAACGYPQYLPFACQCVICGVLGRRSGLRFVGLHAEAGLHHTAVEAAAGRVLTGLAHRGELAACGGHRRIYVVTHRFCCPNSRISQGRGSVRGEPLTGSPARVQSPARRRPILHSKIAAPKKKRHTFVCLFFFGASSGIYPKGHKLRLPGGKTAKTRDAKRRLSFLVPRRGFEPRTPCLKGRCSTY